MSKTMHFIADFHIHSHYSMATSKDCQPEHLALWAGIKGLQVIGSGDFTHPGWIKELQDKLEPAEEGLYRLKADCLPGHALDQQQVRFLLSSEISSIYKKNGRVRKIHNLILVPDIASAIKINNVLDRLGNIRSDGRPILGLDSRNLLEIALDCCPEVIFIPAHIWTPHFSLLGSRSGFDSLEECFEDLSEHIFALETGLSSDPAMNWRLSALDRYALVSNSDAHSPKNLAREANCFETDLSYSAIKQALQAKDPEKFLGTIEFFPQEGKYHYDGHRACQLCWSPDETLAAAGVCPRCGKKVTIGVMYRVSELADRPVGVRPDSAVPYESIIPLPHILSDLYQVGENSKRVQRAYRQLLDKLGNELQILRNLPLEEIQAQSGSLLAEGIRRMREGKVDIRPGFDGEYGKVRLFGNEDRQKFGAQISLFGLKNLPKTEKKKAPVATDALIKFQHPAKAQPPVIDTSAMVWFERLNQAQQQGVSSSGGPIIIVAGPGTGKTRTLVCRIAHLVQFQQIALANILAVTFTNKAARELKSRIREILPGKLDVEALVSGTFHQLCLRILREEALDKTLLDEQDALLVLKEVLDSWPNRPSRVPAQRLLSWISRVKSKAWALDFSAEAMSDLPTIKLDSAQQYELLKAYQHRLQRYQAYDYDDLLLEVVKLFRSSPPICQKYRSRFSQVLVDEFQDVNEVQYLLVKMLAGNGDGLLVIGDPDQAIYSFRGADYRFFSRLQEDFPAHQIFHLEENYRSQSFILQAAEAVIKHNQGSFPRQLKPVRPVEARQIQLRFVASEQAEGISIVREIGRLMGGIDMLQAHGQWLEDQSTLIEEKKRGFSDFAVLFRTAQQAGPLEECFLRAGIPYRVVGQKGFLQNPLVQTVVAALKFMIEPTNDFCLWNLVQHWEGLESGTRQRLQKIADQNRCSLLSAVKHGLSRRAFPEQARESLQQIVSLRRACELQKSVAQIDLIVKELNASGLEISHEAKQDLERLRRCANQYPSVSTLVENLLLFRDGDLEYSGSKNSLSTEAVSLMTIHAAKGLEFPVVFICGLEEGLLPYEYYQRGQEQANRQEETLGEELQEERRLFYVALTRARDDLVLISARRRRRYNQVRSTRPSAFLAEIPAELMLRTKNLVRSRQLRLW